MRRYLPALMLGLLATSCCGNKCNEETSRFHEDGRAKPIVALTSMIDTTSFDAPWSVSEELTTMILSQVSQSGDIYVSSQEEFPYTENPFGADISWMKREFHSQEFIVFLELVEHEAVPVTKNRTSPQDSSTNLNMAVRIRVIDLRGPTPKIVL